MKRHHVVLLLVLAAIVRFLPLGVSPLPFNVDGFASAATADGFLATGTWAPDGHEHAVPAAHVLLAVAAAVTGIPPLVLAQLLFSLLGVGAVLATWALTQRHLRGSGTGLLAGLALLAFLGSYVYFTSVVMKQATGYVLLPVALALLALVPDRRAPWLGGLVLLALPLFHHLVAILGVVAAALTVVVLGVWHGWRHVVPHAVGVGLSAVWAVAWFSRVGRDVGPAWYAISGDAWLYGSLLLALALGLAFLVRRPRDATLSARTAAVAPVAGAAVLGASAAFPLFEGTARTPLPVAAMGLVYVLILLTCAVGVGALLATRARIGAVTLGLAGGVLSLLLFALLRGMDALSFILVHRVFDYLALAFAVTYVLGVAILAKRWRRPGLAFVAVALPALTLPLAVGGASTLVFDNHVSPAEHAGITWAADHVDGTISTDTQWGFVLGQYGVAVDRSLPLDLDRGVRPSNAALVGTDWDARGADAFPLGRVVVDVDRHVGGSHVAYDNGVGVVTLPREPAP